jgi:hypothetical protein
VLDLDPGQELLQQRQQDAIHHHHAIAGMVDDRREIVRMQAQVQRVQDRADGRDAEIRFQMLVVIPPQSSDAVSGSHAEILQRHRELLRARDHVAVAVAMDAAIGKATDDLDLGGKRFRAPHDGGNRELILHHQTAHASSSRP